MGAEAAPCAKAVPAAASVRLQHLPGWVMPAAAGAAMLVPVNLWDMALERELAQAAIRGVCRDYGVQPRDGEVVRCNDSILWALVRGHRASWVINAAFVMSYVGGPLVLNAGMAAWVSHVTRRVVQRHLQRHGSLDSLTEDVARTHVLALLPWSAALAGVRPG